MKARDTTPCYTLVRVGNPEHESQGMTATTSLPEQHSQIKTVKTELVE
jgi:hypothetical protein